MEEMLGGNNMLARGYCGDEDTHIHRRTHTYTHIIIVVEFIPQKYGVKSSSNRWGKEG
jgi:hypothetical protein